MDAKYFRDLQALFEIFDPEEEFLNSKWEWHQYFCASSACTMLGRSWIRCGDNFDLFRRPRQDPGKPAQTCEDWGGSGKRQCCTCPVISTYVQTWHYCVRASFFLNCSCRISNCSDHNYSTYLMLLHKCSKNVVYCDEICSKYVVNWGKKSKKYVVFIGSLINKCYTPPRLRNIRSTGVISAFLYPYIAS